MVQPGKFVLHSRAVPPLPAGDYVLIGNQSIDAGGARPTAEDRTHLRVTSPRFKLPPDQILSTFPPANSAGAYESRLPQIVLKRRTLPWDRAADPADRSVPWLALVVIAEGEGELSDEVPVADCVSPGVVLAGPNDVARGVYLSVPQTTVTRVFPTRQDLPLLAHVREVDLSDTENAMGDDDGFLAVVLANRLPQFDRVGCKPVRYMACLINLEGQLAALPPPTPPVRVFVPVTAVFNALDLYTLSADGGAGGSPDKAVMGSAGLAAKKVDPKQAKGAAPAAGAAIEWKTRTEAVEQAALTSSGSAKAAFNVRDAMKAGFRVRIEGLVAEKTYRFPVLAHWSFTCDGGGSFESLMQGLDVGLLGTLPGPETPPARPECAVPPPGAAPPPAPDPRPAPEAVETGHVGLSHRTRAGDPVRAWYRGPFGPAPSEREIVGGADEPVLAHASDQLRAVVPDGREDLSLAVAFEMGRLLALSRASFVAALMRWRREQFGAERARRIAELAAGGITRMTGAIRNVATARLGALLGRSIVTAVAEAPERVFGDFRPPVDPGRPLEFLDGDRIRILSDGLGIGAEALEDAAGGILTALDRTVVPQVGPEVGEGARLAGLQAALAEAAQALGRDALGAAPVTGSGRPKAGRSTDALDRINARLAGEDEDG
jgi:hypothetical protein